MTAALAAAGTLCIYAGAVDAGVTLLINATCAGELIAAYADLGTDLPQGDMYTVAYTDPVEIALPQSHVEFVEASQDLARHLLLLHLALRNLHRSSVRAQAVEAVLESNSGDPQDAEYQDAQIFRVYHQQAIWRNLALCTQLQRELLQSAARVNVLWRHYKTQLPFESRLSAQNVSEIFATSWQEHAHEIAAYELAAFGIDDYTAALEVVKQKGQLTDPALLLDGSWHKQLHLLSLSFQQALDDFYTQEARSF